MSAMTASERRQQIARLLSASQAPISATTLSQELGVSRQIIVGISPCCVPPVRRSPPPHGAM